MVLFSIIVPHYQGAISTEMITRGLESLKNQTFKDFEVLLYHDGPLLYDEEFLYPIKCMSTRYDDWGHSLRDRGIREAKGEYIIHFNPDNVLYSDALQELERFARNDHNIITYPIKMMGLYDAWEHLPKSALGYSQRDDANPYKEDTPRDYSKSVVLEGKRIQLNYIDCMQFVMKRELWLKEGGWKNKSFASDGYQIVDFVSKYGYMNTGSIILGEHW